MELNFGIAWVKTRVLFILLQILSSAAFADLQQIQLDSWDTRLEIIIEETAKNQLSEVVLEYVREPQQALNADLKLLAFATKVFGLKPRALHMRVVIGNPDTSRFGLHPSRMGWVYQGVVSRLHLDVHMPSQSLDRRIWGRTLNHLFGKLIFAEMAKQEGRSVPGDSSSFSTNASRLIDEKSKLRRQVQEIELQKNNQIDSVYFSVYAAAEDLFATLLARSLAPEEEKVRWDRVASHYPLKESYFLLARLAEFIEPEQFARSLYEVLSSAGLKVTEQLDFSEFTKSIKDVEQTVEALKASSPNNQEIMLQELKEAIKAISSKYPSEQLQEQLNLTIRENAKANFANSLLPGEIPLAATKKVADAIDLVVSLKSLIEGMTPEERRSFEANGFREVCSSLFP